MDYVELLRQSADYTGNVACMGLDPVMDVLPGEGGFRDRVNGFFEKLFRRMKLEGVSPAAFKPNIGYYVINDRPRDENFEGSQALADVLDMLSSFFPSIPVILDSKRGDIAKSSLNYAREAFEGWGADAVTVSPYMGSDSVLPFAFADKGIYVLNRTSNPGGRELQNILTIDKVEERDVYPLYIAVAHHIAAWAGEHAGIGAVVGATSMEELKTIVRYYAGKDIPTLIPGVGSQGGSAQDVMGALREASYDVRLSRINSSSGLTHPWKKAPVPEDWLEMCMASLRSLVTDTQVKA